MSQSGLLWESQALTVPGTVPAIAVLRVLNQYGGRSPSSLKEVNDTIHNV